MKKNTKKRIIICIAVVLAIAVAAVYILKSTAVPYINVYGASKAYVLNFSRALGVELKSLGIHVMAVAPGWIKTEFFDHAVHDNTIKYYDRYYTAEQVVTKAMKDLKRNKKVSILGFPVRLQVLGVKLLPNWLVMKVWCRQQGK